MKQATFVTKVAKAIADNEIRTTAARRLMMQLASTGECRPCWEVSRAYSDHTEQILAICEKLGMWKQGTCRNGENIRKGWLLKNDAPRGGKCGNIIVVKFD